MHVHDLDNAEVKEMYESNSPSKLKRRMSDVLQKMLNHNHNELSKEYLTIQIMVVRQGGMRKQKTPQNRQSVSKMYM